MVQVREAASGDTMEIEAGNLVWVRGSVTSKWGDRGACWASLETAISAEELAAENLDTAPYVPGQGHPWGQGTQARLFSRDGETLWLVEAK